MALRIQCPRCQTQLQVADEHRGRQVRCPTCSSIMMVPGPATTHPSHAVRPAAPAGFPAPARRAVISSRPAKAASPPPLISTHRHRQASLAGTRARWIKPPLRLAHALYLASKQREGSPWFFAGAGGASILFIGLFIVLSGSSAPRSGEATQVAHAKSTSHALKKKTTVSKTKATAPAVAATDKTEVKTSNYPAKLKEETAPPVKVVEPPPKAVQPPPGPAPADIASTTIRQVKKATAYLRVTMAGGQTAEGSGFFAAEPGLVFTNAHVLGMLGSASQPPTKVDVVVNSGEPDEFTLTGQLLGADRGSDLAILRASGDATSWPAPLPLDGSQSLTELQKVYVFGFPFGASLGKNITISPSSVSSLRRGTGSTVAQIQVNGGMNPGNSGGPVVDSRGAVVGVSVSIIRGTQINFAVPGEKVQALLHGRVADVRFGEPYQDGAQIKLPVLMECVDPLKRIRSLRAEVWTGKPGTARPTSAKAPEMVTGDSQRQLVPLKYEDGKGQGEIVLPAVGGGQVAWVQPALEAGGGYTSWAVATTVPVSEFPPVQRTAVTLQQRYDGQAERTLKLSCDFKMQVSTAPPQVLFSQSLQMAAVEQTQSDPRGGKLRLTIGSCTMTREIGGKTISVNPQAQALMRHRLFAFASDQGGALVKHAHPTLEAFYPAGLRQGYEELASQVSYGYEMTCLAVPNRLVQPRETWDTRLPITVVHSGKRELMDVHATCTYEGSRQVQGQNQALISITGNVKARQPGTTASGKVSGKVHFNVDKGYLSWADLTMEADSVNDTLFSQAMHIHLTRAPGNTLAISPVPPGAKPAPGRAQVLLHAHASLTDQDPADSPDKRGCHYKTFSVNLTAGHTYILEMNVQGKSNLDPYLVLLDPNGKKVAEDDDSGGQLNALLVYQAPVTGTYQIHATTFPERNVGPFAVRVSEIVRDEGQGDDDEP